MYNPINDTYTEDFLADLGQIQPVLKQVPGMSIQKIDADVSIENVLSLKNVSPYTPTLGTHPATKGYVDDRIDYVISLIP